jgi:opacity protein-like surface antigen
MKNRTTYWRKSIIVFTIAVAQQALSQGYDTPLTIQGIDHSTLPSATSRSLGGTTLISRNDITLMFTNPASLSSVSEVQVSLGGLQHFSSATQEQQYAPLKYYSNFSLLMEGLTGYIPNPDSTYPGVNPGDTVQRPFDGIGPNWSRTHDHSLPVNALAAVPFTIGEMTFVAGAGMTRYADLDNYYQNNNVLSPSVLSERPLPINRPPSDSVPVIVQWSQFARAREGAIRGYGIALAGRVPGSDLSVGISGMVLHGSSDDAENRVARGRLTFYTNYFRLDSVYRRASVSGTSDYSGMEFTLSSIYQSHDVKFGFSVKAPTTITRDYSWQSQTDSGGGVSPAAGSGSDKLRLPWRGSVGLSIAVRENLTIGVEYEIKPYASAEYTSAGGSVTNPWLSVSSFSSGAEYVPLPWLAVRAGLREQAEVFEPEGNPIAGDPASATVYAAGVGITSGGFHFNVAYEYALLKYQDIWGSAISLNNESTYRVSADVSYELHGLW